MNDNAKDLLTILATEKPSEILFKLYDEKTLQEMLPELTDLYIDQKGHKNNFIHTLRVLDQACEVSTDIWFRVAALLHDIGKGPTRQFIEGEWTFRYHEEVGAKMLKKIWERFNFPQDNFEKVELITRYHGLAKELCKPDVSDSAVRRFYKDTKIFFEDLILFCKCDITTKFEDKKIKLRQELEDLKTRTYEIDKKDVEAAYRIPVDGVWLMEQTGCKPGSWIKEIKTEIERVIKAGEIPDEEDAAKDLAIQLLKSRGLL